MKRLTILFKDATVPIELIVSNEWQESKFYCCLKENGDIVKWPTRNIFRVTIEDLEIKAEDFGDQIIEGMSQAVNMRKK